MFYEICFKGQFTVWHFYSFAWKYKMLLLISLQSFRCVALSLCEQCQILKMLKTTKSHPWAQKVWGHHQIMVFWSLHICLAYPFWVYSGWRSRSLGWKNWMSSADWETRGSQLRSLLQYFCKTLRRTSDPVGSFLRPLRFPFLSLKKERKENRTRDVRIPPAWICVLWFTIAHTYLEIWGRFCRIF